MAQVLISPISNVALAMLVAVFVIVFAVANEALKRMQLFGSMTTPAVALCVTLLSMLGLVRFITLPPTAPPTVTPELVGHVHIDFVLFPYVVLALAIVLTMLLAKLSECFRKRRGARYSRATRHGPDD